MFAPLFFFRAPPTTKIYTLSLHDALPIFIIDAAAVAHAPARVQQHRLGGDPRAQTGRQRPTPIRSEEHTSELQSRENLVCRLLLEKKKKICTTGSTEASVKKVRTSLSENT